MRLVNVQTMELKDFKLANVHPYAIASHRCLEEEKETSFQDASEKRNTDSPGYKKLQAYCQYIRNELTGIFWLWIDTCCIDKKSSEELSFSINSMFEWYRRAAVCLTYLADVNLADGSLLAIAKCEEEFRRSVWFARGWTLQELIAPPLVLFLSKQWRVIGYKGDLKTDGLSLPIDIGTRLNDTIAGITGIPSDVLDDYENKSKHSDEQIFSWRSNRVTFRAEDIAYCMLGILDVNMPPFYSEGREDAEHRLRKAIGRRKKKMSSQNRSGSVVWLPYQTVPHFTERSVLHDKLVDELDKPYLGNPSAHVAAIVGLGGTGKSQLVLNYVEQRQNEYQTILWIDVQNENTARSDFVNSYRALRLSHSGHTGQGSFGDMMEVQAVQRHLREQASTHPWLVIFDNMDDLTWLKESRWHVTDFYLEVSQVLSSSSVRAIK